MKQRQRKRALIARIIASWPSRLSRRKMEALVQITRELFDACDPRKQIMRDMADPSSHVEP